MAPDLTPLQEVLLGLGLEDLIPMWEAVGEPEVAALVDPDRAHMKVAAALTALAEAGRISFYLGPWDADPRQILLGRAVQLVCDERWFRPGAEPNGQRLYYVNVENLADA